MCDIVLLENETMSNWFISFSLKTGDTISLATGKLKFSAIMWGFIFAGNS